MSRCVSRNQAHHGRAPRSLVAQERGSSVVEFALVVSILLTLLIGIIEFGLVLHVRQGLQAASWEGARLASLPLASSDEIRARVRESLSGIDPSREACPPSVGDFCIAITPDEPQPCNLRSGERVRVEVVAPARLDIPLLPMPELALRGAGEFRCEG